MEYHITRDGRKIKMCDLETSHLENIIKWIKRKSKEGLLLRMGGGATAEDMWYDEYVLFGKDAKEQLNYKQYKSELKRRNINHI
jgi:hypothetical protein